MATTRRSVKKSAPLSALTPTLLQQLRDQSEGPSRSSPWVARERSGTSEQASESTEQVSGEEGAERSFPWGALFVGTGEVAHFEVEGVSFADSIFGQAILENQPAWLGFIDELESEVRALLKKLGIRKGARVTEVPVRLEHGPTITIFDEDEVPRWLRVGHLRLRLKASLSQTKQDQLRGALWQLLRSFPCEDDRCEECDGLGFEEGEREG